MRMRSALALTALAGLLAGCRGAEVAPTPSPAVEDSSSATAEPQPSAPEEPTSIALEDPDATAAPARADQSKSEREQLEAWFLSESRSFETSPTSEEVRADYAGATDAQLISAGMGVCDVLDDGSTYRLARSFAVLDLPDGANSNAVQIVSLLATRSLCPEHEAAPNEG